MAAAGATAARGWSLAKGEIDDGRFFHERMEVLLSRRIRIRHNGRNVTGYQEITRRPAQV